jgi:hypothetical protein
VTRFIVLCLLLHIRDCIYCLFVYCYKYGTTFIIFCLLPHLWDCIYCLFVYCSVLGLYLLFICILFSFGTAFIFICLLLHTWDHTRRIVLSETQYLLFIIISILYILVNYFYCCLFLYCIYGITREGGCFAKHNIYHSFFICVFYIFVNHFYCCLFLYFLYCRYGTTREEECFGKCNPMTRSRAWCMMRGRILSCVELRTSQL